MDIWMKLTLNLKVPWNGDFEKCDSASKEYGKEGNYVMGANIAGFQKVAEAMMAHGIV